MSVKTTLLIDGDLYLYRGTSAVEKEVRWDEENHNLFSNRTEGITAVEYEIKKLMDRFGVEKADCVVAISSPPLFRTKVDQTYKAKRAGLRKPVCFTDVREHLEREWNVKKIAGLEADDILGILATRPGLGHRIICSMDKDMRQIPGPLWDHKELQVISETDADHWFYTQTLVGDVTDGYKGCPGVGPAKAKKLLQAAIDRNAHLSGTMGHCVWPAIVDAYEKAGLTEADAITQARLARILRSDDWDFNKKEVKLWQPPTSSTTPEAKP